ncbi:MAG: hypothetical protein HZC41_11715 [Chloroflexi bacterium]|nr:hypothetical protein [Chloroflexota bacterium]
MSDQTMAAQEPLPETYQEADASQVFKWLRRGESCSLVGIGSVGKSNLLNFIMDERIKQRYRAANVIMVFLDPHKLVHLQKQALEMAGTSWPGYEIMISRLRRAVAELYDRGQLLPPAPGQPDLADRITGYYLNLFHTQPLLVQTGIRQLEEAVYEVLRQNRDWKIAFLFDEFEGFRDLPPEFFESLRGVRDEFRYRVMYLTTSRRDPEELVKEWDWYVQSRRAREIMEGFLELFRGFTIYLRLLDEPSAKALMQRLARRYWGEDRELDDARREDLMTATGRHAGLMRRCFLPIANLDARKPMDELCRYLLTHDGVVKECVAIVESLADAERDALWYAARGKPIGGELASRLEMKHLGKQFRPGYLEMQMPVLRHYVFNLPEPKPSPPM